MKFLVDGMVGRLATWLRILGADARDWPHASDDELRRAAIEEDRVLLTRDNGLFNRLPEKNRFFVHYQKYPDQIKEVLLAFSGLLNLESVFTRCTICNVPLNEVDPPSLPQVPADVYEREKRFWRCPSCGKFFWRGSHYDKVRTFLEELKNNPLDARWKF
jgi:uncharacterized protein with PIN domain